jgi:hypothetical protein
VNAHLHRQGAREVEELVRAYSERVAELAAQSEQRSAETDEPLQRVGVGSFLQVQRLSSN